MCFFLFGAGVVLLILSFLRFFIVMARPNGPENRLSSYRDLFIMLAIILGLVGLVIGVGVYQNL